MANIPVEERRGGASWLWWLIGLLLVAGLIWIIVETFDEGETEITAIEQMSPETTPQPLGEAPSVTIGDILARPDDYIGESFPQTEVNVSSVPTDRGFWIVDEGDSLFAVIIDTPQEEPKDINPGQMLRIDDGMLRDRSFLPEMPGVPLDQDTERIVENQPIFLTVDEQYINILEGGTPQPGTDPAQTVQ